MTQLTKKFVVSLLIVSLLIPGCAHPLEVKQRMGSDSLMYAVQRSTWKSNFAVGVEPFQSGDRYADVCYASLVRELQAAETFKGVIQNFTGGEFEERPDFVFEVQITPEYRIDRGKNFAIQWPGFIIFMPAWHGLVYTLLIHTTVTIKSHPGGDVIDIVSSEENYRVKYTSPGRGILTGFPIGWFFFGALSLLSNAHIEWSDSMRDDAYLRISREYGIIVAQKVIEAFSRREEESTKKGPRVPVSEESAKKIIIKKGAAEGKILAEAGKASTMETLVKAAASADKMGTKEKLSQLTEPKAATPGEFLVAGGPIAVDEIRGGSRR